MLLSSNKSLIVGVAWQMKSSSEQKDVNVWGFPFSPAAQQLLLCLLLHFWQVRPWKWLCFLRSFFKSQDQTCRGRKNPKGKWKMSLSLLPLVVSAFQFTREKKQSTTEELQQKSEGFFSCAFPWSFASLMSYGGIDCLFFFFSSFLSIHLHVPQG